MDHLVFFQIFPDDLYKDIHQAFFLHALDHQPQEPKTKPNQRFQDLAVSCLNSSLRAKIDLEKDVDPSLGFWLLGPTSSHHPILYDSFEWKEERYHYQLDWGSLDATNRLVSVFVQLMEMKYYLLASTYL